MQIAHDFDKLNKLNKPIAEYLLGKLSQMLSADDLLDTFQWSIGGDVHILETQAEVDHLLQTTQFDIWEFVVPGNFYMGVNINNNAGGPTYFIPGNFSVDFFQE